MLKIDGERLAFAACGHLDQIVPRYRIITRPDGTVEREREPQKFRARGADARYCLGCHQIVDAIDDEEARLIRQKKAP